MPSPDRDEAIRLIADEIIAKADAMRFSITDEQMDKVLTRLTRSYDRHQAAGRPTTVAYYGRAAFFQLLGFRKHE